MIWSLFIMNIFRCLCAGILLHKRREKGYSCIGVVMMQNYKQKEKCTMLLSAQLFIEDLKRKDLKFDIKELSGGETLVNFPFDGKMTNIVFSGEDGKYVSMYTNFESIPADKVADLYVVCNQLNATYKWLKFYVDKDNDLMVEDDAIVSPESAADECFELILRRANVLKDVKPVIMRAIYL